MPAMAEKTTPPNKSTTTDKSAYQPPKSARSVAKAEAAQAAKPDDGQSAKPAGERIAKVLSRAGIASRREAERLIEIGEVAVNGKVITSPALNVTGSDKITVGGKPVKAAEPARLWLYYKPEGLVTSESDEKGRQTVFETLPEDLPRVMSVGRLDLNSEGLLLLTNDGELKRRLELPSTGWLRKYRVRINGNPTDVDLEPLRRGIVLDGERFQPMSVVLDRIQGANAWLTIGLREGKNREIRRALNALDLFVNRLIRVSYGPFRLGDLEPGGIEEIKPRVLRDQLGLDPMAEEEAPKKAAPPKPAGRSVSHGPSREGGKPRAEGPAPRRRNDALSDAPKPRSAPKPGPKTGPSGDPTRPPRPRRPA
jgi:23S rRNA pseudouridine2605 synthase